MEIILGDGPGPIRQVADPFQKYWGCTFANQVCELAQNYPQWPKSENAWSCVCRYRATYKNIMELQGESFARNFQNVLEGVCENPKWHHGAHFGRWSRT